MFYPSTGVKEISAGIEDAAQHNKPVSQIGKPPYAWEHKGTCRVVPEFTFGEARSLRGKGIFAVSNSCPMALRVPLLSGAFREEH